LPHITDANVLVGTETHDDAGVYRLTDEIALVQTIDFFPPVVDDPYVYGQIAAANALSDIYAMGAEPRTALNLVGYPDDELAGLGWLGRILEGGAERCQAAGVAILGGHSVRDEEIKFGMAVTGIVHPKRVLTNAGAKPGDRLILTKALGTGFVTTAAKKEDCPPEVLQVACESMVQLNKAAKEAILAVGGVHAVTDITGFGFAGHAYEMASGSNVTLRIELNALPILPGVEEHGLTRYRSRASRTNADYVAPHVSFEGKPDPVRVEFLWDAQTSGGLLISVEPEQAGRLLEMLQHRGVPQACIIGDVLALQGANLIFRA
jgi:selenide, water dikinase